VQQPEEVPIKEMVKVQEAYVRRLVAEYVLKKLDGKLITIRVAEPITQFFDASVEGCEYEVCNLVLRLNDSEEKTLRI
jgi:hypothetical protein